MCLQKLSLQIFLKSDFKICMYIVHCTSTVIEFKKIQTTILSKEKTNAPQIFDGENAGGLLTWLVVCPLSVLHSVPAPRCAQLARPVCGKKRRLICQLSKHVLCMGLSYWSELFSMCNLRSWTKKLDSSRGFYNFSLKTLFDSCY